MPQRTTYRDALTGRFVSLEDALDLESVVRTVYQDNVQVEQQLLQYGGLQENLTPDADPNWDVVQTKWGESWTAGDDGLSLSALATADFPDDATGFRVLYQVNGDGRYPNRLASTETLLPDQWPPALDLLEGANTGGIAYITFTRTPRDA